MKQLNITPQIFVCQTDELTADERKLIEAAIEATGSSYAPYSHFSVGAAALLANGTVVKGSNQENAAFPSGLCAERTALFAAGAQFPEEPVVMLAIAARNAEGQLVEEPAAPCGACRQVMLETETRYNRPMRILLYGRKVTYVADGIRQFLPMAFSTF